MKSFSFTQQPSLYKGPKNCVVKAQAQQNNNVANKASKKLSQASKFISGLSLGLIAMPALAVYESAEELNQAMVGPGHLFDFDLTLPVMAIEFLTLMVVLEKTWFGPVGKVLDDRDKLIRDKLSSVKGGGTELEELQKETEQTMKKAFLESQNALNQARAEAAAQNNEKVTEAKKVQDQELQVALQSLEREKEKATTELDKQVKALSQEILKKILPQGVKA